MFKPEDVVHAAEVLYPYLPDLLGDKSKAIQIELDNLLKQAKEGKSVGNQISALLARYEPTRMWMRSALVGDESSTRIDRFSGRPVSINAGSIYKCPEPSCLFVWTVRAAGQPIPPCPEHQKILVAVTS